ncbi:exopolysaccharide biosynthesis polyprenyl glycosylphosphotransferase [Aliiruegeria lutimaris]|uniref:Exopolysaccharide biosynthesis polyprenyl glycosylphosphotransferase n=2 Tax=Aliiruegeria lutimaris TaxID=571298 RepID=A0A1G8WLH5_9RHOB|nr:exopolysaccharide biosynthesis polyprenyl glycosylphosphotransferase [Aliiruegeria lutimaris]
MPATQKVPAFVSLAAPGIRAGEVPLFKRPFDILAATAILLAIAPLLALIALSIKLGSRGPVFFRQERVGRNGSPFTMWKFRSMYVDAEARLAALQGASERDGVCFKMRDDPRVTAVGRLLRRSSLDELPQLFNVLLGDMSLVGPRPALPREVAQYSANDRNRLAALPGITGLWQVSGRADISFEEMIRLDLAYIRDCSLLTDLRLLLATVSAVVTARGAY